MEQHPVPQNITTFQFRLIGDMTIKQFAYLAGGIIVGYVCYKLPLPIFFTLPMAAGSALMGFGLAFVPIEERPMDTLVLAFLKNVYSPTLFVWQKEKPLPQGPAAVAVTDKVLPRVPVPTGVVPPAASVTPPQTMPTQPVTAAASPLIMQKPAFVGVIQPPQVQIRPIATRGPAPETPKNQPHSPLAPQISMAAKTKGEKVTMTNPFQKILDMVAAFFAPKPKNEKPRAGGMSFQMPPTVVPSGVLTSKQHTDQNQGFFQQLQKMADSQQQRAASKPGKLGALPDMFNRPITPQVAGKPFDPSMQKPANQTASGEPDNRSGVNKDSEQVTKIEKQSHELEAKLRELESQLKQKTESESRVYELQKQLTQVLSERKNMENELMSLRDRISRPQMAHPAPTRTATVATPQVPAKSSVRVITSDTAVRAGLPRLTSIPNVVTGIIKDHENNQLPGVLVTVRDINDIPLRALKTNKLGQFAASTPLPNGTYYIEVEDPRSRYIFDRIQVTLSGGVVPAVEVSAKSQKQLSREKLAKEIFSNGGA